MDVFVYLATLQNKLNLLGENAIFGCRKLWVLLASFVFLFGFD